MQRQAVITARCRTRLAPMVRGLVSLILGIAVAMGASIAIAKDSNLLRLDGVQVVRDSLTPLEIHLANALIDGDKSIASEVLKGAVEFVVKLPELASARKMVIHLSSGKGREFGMRVEVLGSIVSSDSGFQLLRSGTISANKAIASFEFLPNAVRWVLLRIRPSERKTSIRISEIQLFGSIGAPTNTYQFQDNPADTQQVLRRLRESLTIDVSAAEKALFADAADGRLDTWTLEQAALLASGITETRPREALLIRLNKIKNRAAKAVGRNGNPFKRAQTLLTHLHKFVLQSGYVETQTDLSELLNAGTYNCVSSAVLYAIVGEELGLDVRGIEVPDHAFAIVYDKSSHADVETTTSMGFNPARNRQALRAFSKQTGFAYIPGSNASKRRETSPLGLVALIYYNHGVTYSRASKHEQALLSYYRALQLDPRLASAVKNTLASLGRWAEASSKNGRHKRALSLIETGLSLAPGNRTLLHNRRIVWQRRITAAQTNGNLAQVIALTDQAHRVDPKARFDRQQADGFIVKARSLAENNQWDDAIALVEQGRIVTNDASQKSLNRFATNLLLRWMSYAINAKNWDAAFRAARAGIRILPKEARLKRNAAYLLQEASIQRQQEGGRQAGIDAAKTVLSIYPDNRQVKKAATQFVRRSLVAEQVDGDIAQTIAAIDSYSALITTTGERERMVDSVVLARVSKHLKAKDWSAAAMVYAAARAAAPKEKIKSYRQNVAYLSQQWLGESGELRPVLAADLLSRFPDISSLPKIVAGHYQSFIKMQLKRGGFELAFEAASNALKLLGRQSPAVKLVRLTVDRMARSAQKNGDMQVAVDTYQRGLVRLPADRHLTQNAIAIWHAWAKQEIDRKRWDQAIAIYESGLERLPNTSLFKKNIRYCQQQRNAK